MMQLIFKKLFKKSYSKLDKKIQEKADSILDIFMENPLDISLNNHKLSGELSNFRSISVTGDYRIRIHQLDSKTYEIVEIIDIGKHSELYG